MNARSKAKSVLLEEIKALERKIQELEKRETARSQAEALLKEEEAHFRRLLENAPLPYQSLDKNGCVLIVNQAWLKCLGYGREEVIGKWFGDFLSLEDKDRFRRSFSRFEIVGEVRGIKFKVIKKNKSTAEVSFDGSVAYDSGGNFLQTHCIFQELRNPESGDEELDGIPADEEGPSHNPDLTTLNLPPKLQFASLTPREIEVCELIRKGLSIKEIAHFLKTSPRTVESHRNHICKKLGFSDKKKNLTSYLRMGYELKCGLKIHRILL